MERGFFLNGDWTYPQGMERFEVRDPASGEHVGSTLLADEQMVDQAVTHAEEVAPALAAMRPEERAAILKRAADLIDERIDEMALLLTREQGNPVPDHVKEISFGARVLRYYAEEATRIWGSVRPSLGPNIKSIVSYHPVGVAAAIIPWNYPIDLYCWKVGPAIATGCPLVVKSPPETPLAIAMLVDCLHEAGLPAGALADIPGHGPIAGAALARHPRVRALSATASIPAGQDIMRNASGNLKKLVLELGGNAPLIVLADADLDEAARATHRRAFSNMGQICITVNRVLVDKAVYGEFTDRLAALTQETVLGHGIEQGVQYGPVLNPSIIERTERHKQDALSKGARLITGGHRPKDSALDRGHFYRPTLLADAPLTSLPMSEETFGPLIAMASFDKEETMIAMANDTEFGLAAYLYGGDLAHMWRIADQIEAGGVGLNVNDVSELQAPFGGWKMSGIGRELGPEGLEAYLQPKLLKMRV